MLVQTFPQIMTTEETVVAALARIRREWEEAAEGCSLINVQGSVGLLLDDIVKALDLPVPEQTAILGKQLSEEIAQYTQG